MTRKVKTCVTIQDVKRTRLWYAPSMLNTFQASTHMSTVCNKTERGNFLKQIHNDQTRMIDSISNTHVRRGACKILFLLHNHEFLRTPATKQNKPKLICEHTSMCVCISISCQGPLWGAKRESLKEAFRNWIQNSAANTRVQRNS